MNSHESSNSDEIDILNYIRVIIKGKTAILIILFLCLSLSMVISLLLPKLYEVSMHVLPPTNEEGEYVYGIKYFSDKVKDILFISQLKKELNLQKDCPLNLQLSSFDGNIIRVSMRSKKSDVAINKKILDKTFELLVKTDDARVIEKRQLIDQSIYMNRLLLKEMEEKLKVLDKEIAAKLRRIEKNKSRFDTIKSNIRLFESKIDLLSKEKKIEEKKNAEFSTTKSTMLNLEYFKILNDMNSDLFLVESEGFILNTEIERLLLNKNVTLKKEIKEIEFKLERNIKTKSHIKNICQVQPPQQTEKPVKPRIKQNIAISAIVGLLLGILLVFARDESLIKVG